MVRLAAPFRLRRPRIRRSASRPFRGPGGPASDLAALDGPGRRTTAGPSRDVPGGPPAEPCGFRQRRELLPAEWPCGLSALQVFPVRL